MTIEKRLEDLGITLPGSPAAAGNYVASVRSGNLLYLSGTICAMDGKLTHTGQLGAEHSIESGYEAAQVCALNALANIKAALGSLDAVARVVQLNGFVNAVAGFSDSPAVINGASDLFVKVFGDLGRHSRAAVAVAGLPRNSTVEIQLVVEVR